MTIEEKKKFIDDLFNSIRDDFQSALEKMPDEWTGIELRYAAKRCFDETSGHDTISKVRKKEVNSWISDNPTW